MTGKLVMHFKRNKERQKRTLGWRQMTQVASDTLVLTYFPTERSGTRSGISKSPGWKHRLEKTKFADHK